ncbi:MAG: DUF4185 domain-containing protein [Clostridiales bacterium]|nr:DUF4185 domain-containing protein [Clostridiales bacterium]
MKKLICTLFSVILFLITFAIVGCTPEVPVVPEPEPPLEPNWQITFNKAETIGSFLAKNDDAGNDTVTRFEVGGTDLGISVNLSNDKTLLLFGDTFADEYGFATGKNNWRSGVIGLSTDYDLSDNLSLDSFWTQEGFLDNAVAESPLWSPHRTQEKDEIKNDVVTRVGGETTKIYTGGIEINDTIYVFYVSRRSLGNTQPERKDSNNYGSCIKSTDGGTTWERVWDLTWVDHSEGNTHPTEGGNSGEGTSAEKIAELVNYDIDGTYVEDAVDITNRQAYYFTQIYPIMGNGDGYVYILGRGGYRTSGIKLGRVKIEDFEDFSKYEYYAGVGPDGQRWVSDPERAVFIVNRPLSNMSIVYNKYIDKWVMSYLDCTTGSGAPLVVSYSSKLTSGWSKPITLIENAGETNGLYGGYLNERWVEEDGKTFYFVYSRYIRFTDDKTTDFYEPDNNTYRSYIAKATIDMVDLNAGK